MEFSKDYNSLPNKLVIDPSSNKYYTRQST